MQKFYENLDFKIYKWNFLENNHTHLFIYYLWLFSEYNGKTELQQEQNGLHSLLMFTIWPFKEKFANPGSSISV